MLHDDVLSIFETPDGTKATDTVLKLDDDAPTAAAGAPLARSGSTRKLGAAAKQVRTATKKLDGASG